MKIRVILAIAVGVLAVHLASCGRAPEAGGEKGIKLPAEALLYDAVLRRDGRPTSFRLEVLHADSVMALAGRGYLGKSGLKGRVTRDSLFVYFPTEHQYVSDSIANLFYSLECGFKPTGLNLLDLFRYRPDSIQFDSSITITSNPSDSDEPAYLVYITDCPWQIELSYDYQKDAGWRVRQFSFFDGKKTHLTATRREFKRLVGVSPSKFVVKIPADAERIEP